jgi:hypothetical protein
MKRILLTLMAVASLTIAAITAKSDEVTEPVTGRDVTVGGVTTHYGAPLIAPDTTSIGKWIPFPVRAEPTATTYQSRYDIWLAELQNRLLALETPIVSLGNGVVVGHGVPSFNHDGRGYAGFTINRSVARDISIDQQAVDNLAALQNEYRKNIKSGKWRKFVNGE